MVSIVFIFFEFSTHLFHIILNLGGGLMGAGIAQVGAQTGHKVTLVDVSQDVLDKSQARISDSIKRVAKKKFKEDTVAGDKFISQAIGQVSH